MKVTLKEREQVERTSDQALADALGQAMNAGDSPEIVVMPEGRSMYEVKDGRARIKVSVADKEHWGETIAHEMGHWACAHVKPSGADEMFRQELEAWEWAMKKGLKFDRAFVEECLFSHAVENDDPAAAVEAMVRADALINRYKKNWKTAG